MDPTHNAQSPPSSGIADTDTTMAELDTSLQIDIAPTSHPGSCPGNIDPHITASSTTAAVLDALDNIMDSDPQPNPWETSNILPTLIKTMTPAERKSFANLDRQWKVLPTDLNKAARQTFLAAIYHRFHDNLRLQASDPLYKSPASYSPRSSSVPHHRIISKTRRGSRSSSHKPNATQRTSSKSPIPAWARSRPVDLQLTSASSAPTTPSSDGNDDSPLHRPDITIAVARFTPPPTVPAPTAPGTC